MLSGFGRSARETCVDRKNSDCRTIADHAKVVETEIRAPFHNQCQAGTSPGRLRANILKDAKRPIFGVLSEAVGFVRVENGANSLARPPARALSNNIQ